MTGRRTLFLNPPSFEGYDGGAGSRYQCRREVRSFWYPTWLAQPAAMVPGSRLVDAPPDDLTMDQVAPLAKEYDSIVMHTSTPSFNNDARVAERLKEENPDVMIGMVGAHVGVLPEAVAAGRARGGLGQRRRVRLHLRRRRLRKAASPRSTGSRTARTARSCALPERPTITDMDAFPSVLDVYRRDLTIPNYFNGYLQHPYLSLYTGRGCKSKCTFCLWPQTIGGHLYRVRSVDSVDAEMARAKELFPEVNEYFFDDDTLTDNIPRVEEVARRLGPLGITWSCNAKPNVPRCDARDHEGQRPATVARRLRVGQPAGAQQHEEGHAARHHPPLLERLPRAGHQGPRHVHLGHAGRDAGDDPGDDRLRVRDGSGNDPGLTRGALSGTYLYKQAQENGWLEAQSSDLVDTHGVQHAALNYPGLTSTMMFGSVDEFYRRFYFRPRKMFSLLGGMIGDRQVMKRRLREGVEFFHFLRERKREQSATASS